MGVVYLSAVMYDLRHTHTHRSEETRWSNNDEGAWDRDTGLSVHSIHKCMNIQQDRLRKDETEIEVMR